MDGAFRQAVAQARRHGKLYFAGLLTEDHIHQAFGRARWVWQGWIYTPAVTVWVFLAQCLSPDHSCRDAVAQLIAWLLASGRQACSAVTGAYCSARDRLPEQACRQLARDTGRQVDEDAPSSWRWLGHRVLDVDGSTLTMAVTKANQAAYPQLASQKRGCGFPIARIVVVFRWRWVRRWTQHSASMRANRPGRTACSGRCTTFCVKATWCWQIVISAAGLIWKGEKGSGVFTKDSRPLVWGSSASYFPDSRLIHAGKSAEYAS
jgi:hypothetical protein